MATSFSFSGLKEALAGNSIQKTPPTPAHTHTYSVSTSSSQTEVISLHPVDQSSPLECELCDISGLSSGSVLHPQCLEQCMAHSRCSAGNF